MKLKEIKQPRAKKIKTWNGMGRLAGQRDYVRVYIGATSMKAATQMLWDAGFGYTPVGYFRDHFSPVWGGPMQGREPEIGIWITPGNGPEGIPKKIA